MKTLYPAFLSSIRQTQLIVSGDTIISACSGGKDSLAQVILLKRLAQDIPITIIAAYFNHQLRSDSDREELFVRNFCLKHNIPLHCGGAPVEQYRAETGLNLEDAASILRYRFLENVSKKYRHSKIATAHTRSDLAETFLLKLIRGSGLQGLSALYQTKERNIIRPLIDIPTEEILAFLERSAIEYYPDPSNRNTRFLRNRIRRDIMPRLKEVEANIEKRIHRSTMLLKEEFSYFQSEADSWLNRHLILDRILPMTQLKKMHTALQRHIIREFLRRILGNLHNINMDHIQSILDETRGGRGLAVPALELAVRMGFVFPRALSLPDYRLIIKKPGEISIPQVGAQLQLTRTVRYKRPTDNQRIVVEADRIEFPLSLRPPRPSDGYLKINADFPQKAFEMIRASGLPAPLRNLAPVLVNGDGRIIWIRGCPICHEFKVGEAASGPFINIKFRPSKKPQLLSR